MSCPDPRCAPAESGESALARALSTYAGSSPCACVRDSRSGELRPRRVRVGLAHHQHRAPRLVPQLHLGLLRRDLLEELRQRERVRPGGEADLEPRAKGGEGGGGAVAKEVGAAARVRQRHSHLDTLARVLEPVAALRQRDGGAASPGRRSRANAVGASGSGRSGRRRLGLLDRLWRERVRARGGGSSGPHGLGTNLGLHLPQGRLAARRTRLRLSRRSNQPLVLA
mmetsp:Transcript_43635/g.141625  ORF Transcript_43635/g.141625 Transcript_43635/m.141625 type:complete len:226 (-) Transcript_43635:296-973(-)